jgi:hypothetical protein
MIKLSLFKIKNKLKIIWIIINHLKNLSIVKGNKKQILIICDGIISHGGLVDRLKGIISFYQIAKLKNFDFKIQFNNPFRLTEFLVPNSYNWITTIVDLKWNPLNTSFLVLMDNFEFDPIASFTKSKKYNFIIYCNVDYLSKIHLDKSKIEVAQIWQNSYRELFTPSKYFKEKLEEVKIESKRIAVHTRFTGLMGDFKDSSNKTISNERKTEILKLLITEINKISLANPNFQICIFSDSIQFLNYIKSNTKFFVIDGTLLHLGLASRKKNIKDHLKTFIDFYLIAQSTKIFLIKTDEMHNSAFSMYASKIENTQFEKIEIC